MIETLLISAIDPTPAESVRAKSDQDTIEKYKESYLTMADMPPIRCYRFKETIYAADGRHRLDACDAAGIKEISADVVDCDSQEDAEKRAWKYAFSANETHGLPRSREDKSAAVKACLNRPEFADATDAQVAEACHVTRSFAMLTREGLAYSGQITGPAAERAKQYKAEWSPRGGYVSDGKGGTVRKDKAPKPKKEEPEVEPAAEPEAEVGPPPARDKKSDTVYDSKGRPTTKLTEPAFKERAWFKEMTRDLDGWLERLKAAAGKPHTACLFLNEAEASLLNLKQVVASAAPHIVCPQCSGFGAEMGDSCPTCRDRGWLPRSAYTLLTAAQLAAVKEWESDFKRGNPKSTILEDAA